MQAFSKRPHTAAAAAAVATVLMMALERRRSSRNTPHVMLGPSSTESSVSTFSRLLLFAPARCEASRSNVDTIIMPSPSWLRRTLASLHLTSLPMPRRLLPSDSVFNDSTLQQGLRRRERDEEALRVLQLEAIAASENRDPEAVRVVYHKICEIAFGKGVTPQIREDFVMVRKYLQYVTLYVLRSLWCIGCHRNMVVRAGQTQSWTRW